MTTEQSTLPRKTFARKIVSMMGYDRAQAIIEVASVDSCTQEEAARRYDLAMKQHIRRSTGQSKRHHNAKMKFELASDKVLLFARDRGMFRCPEDLREIRTWLGWGFDDGYDSTGRVYREMVLTHKRAGFLAEKRDEDDKLVGYILTDTGLQFLDTPI